MSLRDGDMTIGALARVSKSSIQTIRFYERIGLLPAPPRTVGGRRIYSHDHLQRLNAVRRYRKFGFSISQIRILLNLIDKGIRTCSDAQAIAQEQRNQLRQKIALAQALERELSAYIDCCAATCTDRPSPRISLQEALARGASPP